MNDTIIRRYPMTVRPGHLETEESYSRRLLTANFETDAHKRQLTRETAKRTGLAKDEAWTHVLQVKTGRNLHLTKLPEPSSTQSALHSCEHCTNYRRTMCLLCAHGNDLIQSVPFAAPVCVHHGRWLGERVTLRFAGQFPVPAETVRAALRFARLQKQGRLTPALFTVLREAARTRTATSSDEMADAKALPTVIAVAAAVTTATFSRALFTPGLTFKDAYRYLDDAVTRAAGENRPDISRGLWQFFKPTFWALRHAVYTNTPYTPAWPHDFEVTSDIADAYLADFQNEPFTNFLSAPDGTPLDAEDRGALNRDGLHICAEGHQITPTRQGHCPICKHSEVAVGYNDLATVNPRVARELDDILNGPITARDIPAATHKDLAWRCPQAGHVYWATASNRTQAKTNCPICSNRKIVPGINDLTTTHPRLVAEMEPEYIAGHPPTSLCASSEEKPRWVCPTCEAHYKMSVYDRTHGSGCEPCRKARLRASRENLTVTHPEVAALWHPSRNITRPDEYTYGSNKEVWWLCTVSAAHFYTQRIDRKAAGYGCSICSRRKLVIRVNDLATTDPLLSIEFHPDRNGAKKPDLMMAGTAPYYWSCLAAGHLKRQSVPNRRKSKGCTDCPPEHRILAEEH